MNQFLRRGCRRPDFADHNTGRVIGKNGRFERGGPSRDCKGERRNHGVTRAGYIEYFLCHRGNVIRRLAALAEQHAQFAERDEQDRWTRMLKQPVHDEPEIFILQRIGLAGVIRQFRQFKRLLAVGVMSDSRLKSSLCTGLGSRLSQIPLSRQSDLISSSSGCVTTPLP